MDLRSIGASGTQQASLIFAKEVTMRDVQLKRDTRAIPKCPHCSKDLNEVSYRELQGGKFGKRYIYFCPACLNTLGLSHRKGFWMG